MRSTLLGLLRRLHGLRLRFVGLWRLSVRSWLLLLLRAASCRVPSGGLFGDLEPLAFIGLAASINELPP
eukprot:12886898-Prorocentrum_lima.AAC.1